MKHKSRPLLLDSSVIVKWYVDEPDTNQAIKLRDNLNSNRGDLVMTELSYYEVANALKCRGNIPEASIHIAVASLELEDLEVIPFETEVLHSAIETAVESDISVYDAYFVALSDLTGLRLVTADKRLVEKVRGATDIVTLAEAVAS